MATFGFNITAGDPPPNTQFPSTVEGFLSLITQYLEVSGLGDGQGEEIINTIVAGETAPVTDQQTTLWLKENNEGRRVGLLAYSGDSYNELNLTDSGDWADRPTNVSVGEMYRAEDLGFTAIYSAGGWTTLGGVIGDLKYVQGATLQEALDRNPGWREFVAGRGRSLVGVNSDIGETDEDYQSAGNTFGTRDHTLIVDETPSHNHLKTDAKTEAGADIDEEELLLWHDSQTGTGQTRVSHFGDGPSNAGRSTMGSLIVTSGGDQPHENRPPSITAYLLEKYI